MSQRDYNKVYTLGRLCLQILQDGQHDGIAIDLLPTITFAVKNKSSVVAIGFSWICGTVNFGVLTKSYLERERLRREFVASHAAEMGITPKQYALRWGW